ncbi:cyclic amp-responsive element-binding protein 3-like protein [Anaeramoeba flamelloides]|uniref:Cyclic amp-responsive element-binding protein 3-like protein n=1 Tax=Anaeramoeba flamelloides TaxID=1746091 RepID=A0AAV7ZVN9_9EUKA|nr:cyclic amp-responsive element-binding protein 3-like protein [Anaeramoeba flamelloides]
MNFNFLNNYNDFCLETQNTNPTFEEITQEKQNSLSSNNLSTINNYNFKEEKISFDEHSILPLGSNHLELGLIGEIERSNSNYLLQNHHNPNYNIKNNEENLIVLNVELQQKLQQQKEVEEEGDHPKTKQYKKKRAKRIKWKVKKQTYVRKKKRNNKKPKKKIKQSQLPPELLALKPPKKRAQLNKLNIEMTEYESYQLRSLTKEQLGQLSKKDKLERKRIRDRISARNSRQKQKRYLESLETHTLSVIKEKDNVKKRLSVLESENRNLRIEIERLQQLLLTEQNPKDQNSTKFTENKKAIPNSGCQLQNNRNTLKKRRLLTKTQLSIL